jgi:hypothetical protein
VNLRGLVNAAIQRVNPNIAGTWVQSTGGYTTNADGSRTPTTVSSSVQLQVQATSGKDLAHTDGLNIQGVMRTVVMYGNVQGVVRADQQGGDILQFPEVPGGAVRNWRVVSVMETWPTWARVIVALQNP